MPESAERYNVTALPRIQSSHEEEVVTKVMQLFSELQLWRNTFAAQWEEVAELVLPTSRNTFFYGNYNWPGQKKTDRQVDATAMMALSRFGAILDSLLTPRNMIWEQLTTQDPDLKKNRDVRMWYQDVTRILFQQRYAPLANFSSQNQQVYQSLGAFGTGAMFIDQAVNEWGVPISQLRYKAIPLGEVFIHENHQGLVDGFVRWFRLTPRQAVQKWGIDKIPATLSAAFDKQSQQVYNFLHYVGPRTDWDPRRIDKKGKPYCSYYISIEGRCLLQEGGYRKLPIAVTRYDQAPGEVYGRGPAMLVLPAIKTLNAEKRTFLKVGHRAADPVLLTADDGLVDVSLRPGAVNKGGWSMDGHPLIGTLETGNIQITKEMMDEEKSLILDAFLVTLFQILTESPQMTATEVVERTNEKGILIAPTVGRQQSEYLGPSADRELDLLASWNILPPMPDALRRARGDYHINYTSPLARAQRAQEVAGFQRTLQGTLEVVKVTGDPSPFDNFNFDVATVETAEIQAVPENWMATSQEVAQKRQQRAQAQQRQEQIQAMPAQAAMLKAQQSADAKGLVTQNTTPGQPGAAGVQPGQQ